MSIDQLHPYGIFPYRFSAICGWDLDLDVIDDIGVKYTSIMDNGFMATTYLSDGNCQPHDEPISVLGRTYFCHGMARGTIGCILSHLSVLMDAYKSGYETIWVMEDDIEVVDNPLIIPDLIDELDEKVGKNGWDILFTNPDSRNANGYIPAYGYARRPNFKIEDRSRIDVNEKISKNLRLLGARFGAMSMIIRRRGIEKILNFYEKYNAYHPYDMDFYAPEGMRMFTVLKDIVTTKVDAITDNGVEFLGRNR